MTPDDILRMAREVGIVTGDGLKFGEGQRYRSLGAPCNVKEQHLLEFAALVAAAEREECATVAERATARKRTLHKMTNNLPELPPCAIAAAIRSRGKP